jgi:microcystin-dependent protein
VYHQGLDNYVLYRGYVPTNGTSITTGYPYVLFPPGSIAVLSQIGNTVTHRPNISTITWVADGNGYAVGEKGGFNNVKLHTSEMPTHTHAYRMSGDDGDSTGGPLFTADNNEDHGLGSGLGSTGGNFPHENRPPYYALAFIIYTGV